MSEHRDNIDVPSVGAILSGESDEGFFQLAKSQVEFDGGKFSKAVTNIEVHCAIPQTGDGKTPKIEIYLITDGEGEKKIDLGDSTAESCSGVTMDLKVLFVMLSEHTYNSLEQNLQQIFAFAWSRRNPLLKVFLSKPIISFGFFLEGKMVAESDDLELSTFEAFFEAS